MFFDYSDYSSNSNSSAGLSPAATNAALAALLAKLTGTGPQNSNLTGSRHNSNPMTVASIANLISAITANMSAGNQQGGARSTQSAMPPQPTTASLLAALTQILRTGAWKSHLPLPNTTTTGHTTPMSTTQNASLHSLSASNSHHSANSPFNSTRLASQKTANQVSSKVRTITISDSDPEDAL